VILFPECVNITSRTTSEEGEKKEFFSEIKQPSSYFFYRTEVAHMPQDFSWIHVGLKEMT